MSHDPKSVETLGSALRVGPKVTESRRGERRESNGNTGRVRVGKFI